MKIDRRQFVALTGGVVAAPFVLRPGRAQAAEVTLKLHHFLPPVAPVQTRVFEPWAKKLETESNGRIAVRIFPAMQLGGKPPQLFDQVRDGVVDLAWTLPGYTPGRFPRLETFELPFIAAKTAIVNSKAVQEFAETQLQGELDEVHPICVWAHDQGLIHSRRQVTKLEDMEGLKLRFPTRLAGEALSALGASPVGMPVPQVPESLASGVIDGAVVPWEVVPALKLQELVGFHTGFPGSPTFYTAVFLFAMNKASYENLPADLKTVIDDNSGIGTSVLAGNAWDDAGVIGRKAAEDHGNVIDELSEDEVTRWREKTQPVVDSWLAQTRDHGFDGAKLLDEAKALIAKNGQA
jgi:TRAP-type C4-dicarboxylate transport system substrate-binding protein